MPVRNLRQFHKLLRRNGELTVVEAPVSADQEIAEIHRRVIAANGPALLFTNVEGSKFPVATNLFGSQARTEMAFGLRPQQFVRDAVRMTHEAVPPTPRKLWPFRHLLRLPVGPLGRAVSVPAFDPGSF